MTNSPELVYRHEMKKHWIDNCCDALLAIHRPRLLYRESYAANNLIRPGLTEFRSMVAMSSDRTFEAWFEVYTYGETKTVRSVTYLGVNGKCYELIRDHPSSLGDEF